jgi:hypothetical protein
MLALRRLVLKDMDTAAAVHRASFDRALPCVGSDLLQIAQGAFPLLNLWTFQRNLRARRFYEVNGFVAVRETDGAGSEEKEPDVLYRWARA